MTTMDSTNDVRDQNTIRTFLRPRPSRHLSANARINTAENRVEFAFPRDKTGDYVNNQNEHYSFAFDGVLDVDATQEEVFEEVAKDVIEASLEGYNGTVFAYGQTGSGKTFTITGGAERYIDRGIIPRTISTIFSEASKRAEQSFTIHVSYLEIYNDVVYDLLDPDREIKDIDDLPRVILREGEDSNLLFYNLRVCKVDNEEDALGLLFLGDTNRTISETPMNLASSRSHCIFCLHIQSRKIGEETVRSSKLNLVDLAGSERIKKTGVDGMTMMESRYINLSLHYLEQVIVALQENSQGIGRSHVPYRNSAMTLILRDSLGGNCRTVMIANISMEQKQLDESISTCRFAQRVAMISNEAVINEQLDPFLVIKRLKQEILDLKQEIRFLKGDDMDEVDPTEEEKDAFKKELEDYCATSSSAVTESLDLTKGMLLIRYGFQVMRDLVREANQLQTSRRHQRDNNHTDNSQEEVLHKKKEDHEVSEDSQRKKNKKFTTYQKEKMLKANENDDQSKEVPKDNVMLLKEKFAIAKQQGQKLKECKEHITQLKDFIEKQRLKRSVQNLSSAIQADQSPDPEEQQAIETLTKEKAEYKKVFYFLKDLKKEIESLQRLLETNKQQMMVQLEKTVNNLNGEKETQTEDYISSLGIRDIHPEVVARTKELLTGNPEADKQIITFYQTKSELLSETSH